jgi:hypothetical protein
VGINPIEVLLGSHRAGRLKNEVQSRKDNLRYRYHGVSVGASFVWQDIGYSLAAMANITFERGACVAPYLQLAHFPGTKGCEYLHEMSIGFVNKVLMIDSRAWPTMLAGAIDARHD